MESSLHCPRKMTEGAFIVEVIPHDIHFTNWEERCNCQYKRLEESDWHRLGESLTQGCCRCMSSIPWEQQPTTCARVNLGCSERQMFSGESI